MVKGLYTAASGMMLQLSKQDVIANNIANSSTSSFKRQLAVSSAYPVMPLARTEGKRMEALGNLGSGAVLAGIYNDFSPGSIIQTGNEADLAVGPESFFVVETPQGERLTRSGSFKVNFDGLLSTGQGYPLLDEYGDYVYVEPGFAVDIQGNVSVDGITVHKLKLVKPDQTDALARDGENLYSGGAYEEDGNAQVMQGFLEQSNVNAVKEMVTLLEAVRTYEMLQKVVQAEDELTQTAVDKVGALG